MSTTQPPTEVPTFRDQSAGLMVFGIFQILLGAFCGMMAIMMALFAVLGPAMAKMPPGEAINPQTMIPAMILYFLMSGALIWVGIGSIRARRWAWALTVVVSWMWLIIGVISFISVVFSLGSIMSASVEQQGQPLPPGAIMMIQVISGVMTFGIYVLLPTAFLIFYHRASVLMTCQRRDPQIRWTDRCPLPVLALSLLLASSAVMILPSTLVGGGIMPLFGHLVTGPAGAIVIVLISLISACLAWGTYRLKMAAWWGTLLLGITGSVNMVIMFMHPDLIKTYQKTWVSEAQWEMMQKSNLLESTSRLGFFTTVVCGVVGLVYLFYIRRYFTRDAEMATIASEAE